MNGHDQAPEGDPLFFFEVVENLIFADPFLPFVIGIHHGTKVIVSNPSALHFAEDFVHVYLPRQGEMLLRLDAIAFVRSIVE
jgi:hypothetical protein